MIKYILAGNCHSEPHHHNFKNVRELSLEEFKEFEESVNALSDFNITYSLFEMCEENYKALENYYQELSSLTGGNQENWHLIFVKWNTLTLNYLSSFRMFVDHHESTLDRSSDSANNLYDKFKKRTAYHYDKYFSYRFLWKLRNYIQHCGLPACSWELSEKKEGPKKGQTKFMIAFNRDGLLHGFNWKKLTTEIENQPLNISFMPLIRELNTSIIDITKFITNLQIMDLQKPLDILSSLISEVIAKYPTAVPHILKWDISDKEETNPTFTGIIQFPLLIMTNIRGISKSEG